MNAPASGAALRRAPIVASIMLATIIQTVDITIANVALPHMQGSLSATREQISWVLTSYIVAAAAAMPATGWLAARFGRRRLFVLMIGGFTVVSMLCASANSIAEMVIYRLLQGVCGAGLVPLSQSVLLDIYPKERHGQAMAIWSMGVVIGPIVGPTLGGWLTETYDWRAVFYINLPIGALALAGVWLYLPESPPDRGRPFDWFGFVLLCLAVGALQMMLDRGELKDWFDSAEIVVEAGLAALAFYLFVAHTLTARRPFLDPAMFRDRNFTLCLWLIFCVGVALLSSIALLPPFLQSLLGYPAVTTGLVMAPRGVGTMAASMIVGPLIGRVDPRALIGLGFAMVALSLWDMAGWNSSVDEWPIVRSGLVQGFGLGFLFAPVGVVAFATLEPRHRGDAAAMFSLMRNLGSSVGIAVMVALLAQGSQVHHALLGEHVTAFSPSLQASGVFDATDIASLLGLDREINRQATTIALINDFHRLMLFCLAAIPLPFLLRLAPRSPEGRPA